MVAFPFSIPFVLGVLVLYLLYKAFIFFVIKGGLNFLKIFGINMEFQDKNENSIKILKERYAKGEITKRQYIKMKKELE